MKSIGPYIVLRALASASSSHPGPILWATERLTGMPVLLHPQWVPCPVPVLPRHPSLLPFGDLLFDQETPYLVTALPPQATLATDPLLAAQGALTALTVLHELGLHHGRLAVSELWSVDGRVMVSGAGLSEPGRPALTPREARTRDLRTLAEVLDELGGLPPLLYMLRSTPERVTAREALTLLESQLPTVAPRRDPAAWPVPLFDFQIPETADWDQVEEHQEQPWTANGLLHSHLANCGTPPEGVLTPDSLPAQPVLMQPLILDGSALPLNLDLSSCGPREMVNPAAQWTAPSTPLTALSAASTTAPALASSPYFYAPAPPSPVAAVRAGTLLLEDELFEEGFHGGTVPPSRPTPAAHDQPTDAIDLLDVPFDQPDEPEPIGAAPTTEPIALPWSEPFEASTPAPSASISVRAVEVKLNAPDPSEAALKAISRLQQDAAHQQAVQEWRDHQPELKPSASTDPPSPISSVAAERECSSTFDPEVRVKDTVILPAREPQRRQLKPIRLSLEPGGQWRILRSGPPSLPLWGQRLWSVSGLTLLFALGLGLAHLLNTSRQVAALPITPVNLPCCSVLLQLSGPAGTPQANVTVDQAPKAANLMPGMLIGQAPGRLKLPAPGKYTLRVKAEGFTPQFFDLTVPTVDAIQIKLSND